MIKFLFLGYGSWLMYGHAICLTTMMWQGKDKFTFNKITKAMFLGPLALNKDWWMK